MCIKKVLRLEKKCFDSRENGQVIWTKTHIFDKRINLIKLSGSVIVLLYYFPPASEASREVANLTRRKNPHPPVNGVKEFVCIVASKQTFLINTPLF